MRPSRGTIRAFATATVVVAALGVSPSPVIAGPAAPTATEPVYDYTQAIRQRVFVESPVDSDRDGRPDRVEVRIIRPKETADGLKVPVIFQPSPYYAGLIDVPNHDDIDRDGAQLRSVAPGTDRAADSIIFAGYLDNYFVP